MKIAKTNCSPIPQSTVRHGKCLRSRESSQAQAIMTTIPSALISLSNTSRLLAVAPNN